MSVLAAALTAAMTTSDHDLAVLDRDSGQWQHHPWPRVHARAQSVAARILDGERDGAIGIVGESSADIVAAVQGGWLAGRSVSILPGPVRGADPAQWARAALDRFDRIGVGTVLSHGPALELLQAARTAAPPTGPTVADLTAAAGAGRCTDPVRPEPGTPAVLQGTAGSTGTPRTARLSPEAVLANVSGLIDHVGVVPGVDSGCSWLPLYHDMGLTFLLSAALSGAGLWLAPTAAFAASPFRWLTWLHDSGATLTAAPNFAFQVIGRYARRVGDVDLSRVRVAINGGEPVDCAALRRFSTELAGAGFRPGAIMPSYGLAEASCAVTAPRPGAGLSHHDGPTGPHAILGGPIPGMQLRIGPAPQHCADLPGPDVGEIQIRGTSMMSGYCDGPELAGDDWFPTGDLGYLTDDGLVVCGRVKELISVAGRNVFPTEIERVAAGVRGVRDGAVVAVGTGDRLRPGLVIAAEFRGPNPDGARRELIARVAAQCAVVPAEVLLLAPGSLPRTSSGKLRRVDVRQHLELTR